MHLRRQGWLQQLTCGQHVVGGVCIKANDAEVLAASSPGSSSSPSHAALVLTALSAAHAGVGGAVWLEAAPAAGGLAAGAVAVPCCAALKGGRGGRGLDPASPRTSLCVTQARKTDCCSTVGLPWPLTSCGGGGASGAACSCYGRPRAAPLGTASCSGACSTALASSWPAWPGPAQQPHECAWSSEGWCG